MPMDSPPNKPSARRSVRASNPTADVKETARALNLANTAYLLDAFGHEPRVSVETAITTLTEIWLRVIGRERS